MKIKIITIILAVVILLAGCGSSDGDISPSPTNSSPNTNTNEPAPIENAKSKYYFEYNNVSIYMDNEAKPILDALGEPMHYFESPSCAFQGMDRVYTYNGFEIYTYTDGDDENENIFTIVFMNDGVETKEGITLGNKLEDVVSKYGENYTKEGEKYTYTDANTNLSLVFENDEVVDVSYNLILN